ncbi:HNH endonuclease [Ensifer sp. ENS12]|uniref:HNH endonuclease n=1 Tax=Ensifer sp. ENS12 TaxID=2854774 RepID=UPI0021026745|nr:HNH endonuclease signature motif containing protein [Ensifer sp. ENS12]
MVAYLLKVNAELHVHRSDQGQEVSVPRPKLAEEWEGVEIQVPTPRALNKGSVSPVSAGDLVWIWTHEDFEYGAGLGLTASAEVENIREDTGVLFLKLRRVRILAPHVRLDDLPKGKGGRAIEAIRGYRHHQAVELNDATLEEFLTIVEARRTAIARRDAELRALYDDPVTVELNNQRETIQANYQRQFTLREVRPGQPAFREGLMRHYKGRCVVSNFAVAEVLEAAHIVPFSEDTQLRDDPRNGLLLRRDLHSLFDALMLSIHYKTGQLHVAPVLDNSPYSKLKGRVIRHFANRQLLKTHFQAFANKWSMEL